MRRRLLIGFAGLVGLVFLSVLSAWIFYGRIGAWVVRERVLPKLEARLGTKVEVGEIEVSRGHAVLHNIVLRGHGAAASPLAAIETVEVDFDYRSSWRGAVTLSEVRVSGLLVRATRRLDGSSELGGILRRVQSRGAATGRGAKEGGARASRFWPRRLRLGRGTVALFDEATGHKIVMEVSSGRADMGGDHEVVLSSLQVDERAMLRGVALTLDPAAPLSSARVEVGDGSVVLWPGMALTGISGTVTHGEHGERLTLDLSGSYRGSKEKQWKVSGWVDPKDRSAQLVVVSDHFKLGRIESALRDTPIKDFENTSVDAELEVGIEDGRADFSAAINVTGLNVEHERLAKERLINMDLDVRADGTFDTRARHLVLDSVSVFSKGVTYFFSGDYSFPGAVEEDGAVRTRPRLAARMQIPTTDCQAVLESIPSALVPKLQGFHLRGPFAADIHLAIDWQDLKGKTELSGFVDLPQCRVLSPSEEFDAERLLSSFEHQTLVGPDEEYETVEIGMESANYVQLFDVASPFLYAVLTHEDSAFYEHEGFIVREFRTALVRNLEAGRFKFGASSISMQMVKNVFLYRDKTMSRKLQELFLTWYVERVLDKNRILEIYVNAIEYGPGVYGIVRAARIYFDKHPRDLNPRESAFLANLLPAPRKRYFEYCKDKVSKRTANKIGRILKNMHNRDRLSDEEFVAATESTIEFNPQKVRELCRKRPDW